MTTLRIVRIDKTLPLPRYQRPGDAGLDLYAAETCFLKAGARRRIRTGLKVAIPEGYEGQVRPRSGLSLEGLDVVLGTIDAGYRGEVQVVVVNNTGKAGAVPRETRIAQLVIAPVARCQVVEVDALDDTERGDGGFGSTGMGLPSHGDGRHLDPDNHSHPVVARRDAHSPPAARTGSGEGDGGHPAEIVAQRGAQADRLLAAAKEGEAAAAELSRRLRRIEGLQPCSRCGLQSRGGGA